ncbi:MAG: DUF4272 domain-containing protein [Steroidobacteraceae bacterium]
MSTPPRLPSSNLQFGFLPAPPPLSRIVARAMTCCALAQRIEIEPPPGTVLDDEARAGTDDLLELSLEWLERHGMAAEPSTAERGVLQTPAGALDGTTRERHAAAGEAAAVIAWSLRCAPLPPFDADADAAAVATALGWLGDSGAALPTQARLRNREDLGTYLDAVSAVHWRLRTAATTPGGGDPVSLARWAVDRYSWPEGVTPLEIAADGDLALGGRSIAAATPQELYAALRRIRERHHATLWLLGQARDWDAINLNL